MAASSRLSFGAVTWLSPLHVKSSFVSLFFSPLRTSNRTQTCLVTSVSGRPECRIFRMPHITVFLTCVQSSVLTSTKEGYTDLPPFILCLAVMFWGALSPFIRRGQLVEIHLLPFQYWGWVSNPEFWFQVIIHSPSTNEHSLIYDLPLYRWGNWDLEQTLGSSQILKPKLFQLHVAWLMKPTFSFLL